MDERYNIQHLLALRKLTRGMADVLRGQMKELLSTLAPLLHPKVVFGNYVDGETYGTSRTGEKAFKEFRELYHTVAQSRPYNLPLEFKSPLEVINPQLEMTPLEYTHVATIGNESKTITVTSPLKWALTYSGFSPGRLKTLLAERKRTGDELQQFVLHYLMMHIVVSKQVGVAQICLFGNLDFAPAGRRPRRKHRSVGHECIRRSCSTGGCGQASRSSEGTTRRNCERLSSRIRGRCLCSFGGLTLPTKAT